MSSTSANVSDTEVDISPSQKDTKGTNPFVNIQSVCKRFGNGPLILDNIDLDIKRGEFVALIGPSGCGKSTLLKLVANLISLTSGKIIVGGGDSTDAKEKLGFVFQDANLMPWMNIRDNVAMPMKLSGLEPSKRNHKAMQMIDMVGLSHVAEHYPRELSGGMRMRVSIARALATEPELLLLDEPFGALDEMTRDDLNEELLKLKQKQGWTGLFVTHSVVESVFLSSKVVVLSANPGCIHKVIPVDMPYPRTAEVRASKLFQDKVMEVTKALHSVRNKPEITAL